MFLVGLYARFITSSKLDTLTVLVLEVLRKKLALPTGPKVSKGAIVVLHVTNANNHI